MTKIHQTIKEINDIINYLKANVTYANPAEKSAWEKRISDLANNDSTKELSLIGLAEFETNLAKQITELIKEKTQLEAKKKQVETERDNKDSLLTTKESELSQKETEIQTKITEIASLTEAKLTKDLVEKINALSTDPNNLATVSSSLDQMTKNFQEIKKANEKLSLFTYLGFGTTIFTGLLLIYQAFFPKQQAKKEREFDQE